MSEVKKEFETIDFSNEDTETLKDKKSNNIFSDFNTDSSFEKEIKKIEWKWKFFYLSLSLKILQFLFWFLVFSLIVIYMYIFIQKSESFKDSDLLNPICNILNWDISKENSWCSSITVNNNLIKEKINNLYLEQTKSIIKILPVIYESESFLNSKEVSFLIDKSENKLRVLDILWKFDYFKNSFTSFEKKKLKCFDVQINKLNNILSMKCEAYSSWYSSEIIWLSWDKSLTWEYLSWTSISIANSFINYLDKNAEKYFSVVDRQKLFESESVAWIDWYTNKTSFDLKLKINF